jgi:predicted enzyme related to lactoylglutathione lyase
LARCGYRLACSATTDAHFARFDEPGRNIAAVLCSPDRGDSREATSMAAPIVFFDIAGSDGAAQQDFYADVFGWSVEAGGRLSVPLIGPMLSGALRTDPADKILYVGVPDVTATLAKIEELGGQIVAPRFEVPGTVVLGLFTDPAGNRMGLVELAGGVVKIP